ncbi:MAG: hypothetical protein IPI73_04075 [Betaproteobacteria bacterium]|nr:hypothetical protein [Betaproteobacteria bacterium]
MTPANFRLTGLIAASFTAFHDNGTLNLDPIEAHAGLLARNGVSGVFVRFHRRRGEHDDGGAHGVPAALAIKSSAAGSRGHGTWDTTAGRRAGARRACAESRRRRYCDGGPQRAAAGGGRRPGRLRGVAAARPDTPYYYYHIPVLTHVRHDMARFMALAAERIPTFAGPKFTDENLMEFGNCVGVRRRPPTRSMPRRDPAWLGSPPARTGAIGSTQVHSAPVDNRVTPRSRAATCRRRCER